MRVQYLNFKGRNLNFIVNYSHLSNNRGGWNKRGGGAKVAKSINVEVGINVEGGIFWKNLLYKCNKRGVEGGKSKKSVNVQGGFLFCAGWNFPKSVSMPSCLLER